MIAKQCKYSHFVDFHFVNNHKITYQIDVIVDSNKDIFMSISDFQKYTTPILVKRLIPISRYDENTKGVSPRILEQRLFDNNVLCYFFVSNDFEHELAFLFLEPSLEETVVAVNFDFDTVTHVTIR